MSKSEIQSWLSSATTDEMESPANGSSWQRDQVLNDWEWSIEYAQDVLLCGGTKSRVQFLQEELLSLVTHADLNLSQIMDIFRLLTLTYPRYSDAPSRDAVEAVGMELVRRDESRGSSEGAGSELKLGVTEQVLGWLSNEVTRLAKRGSPSSYAPSDLFVLLSWSCGIYSVCVTTSPEFSSTNVWRALVGSIAVLLDMLNASTKAKASMVHGALVRVRRALRSAGDKLPVVISTLLALSKSSQAPLQMIPLLGVTVSVLIRLKPLENDPSTLLTNDLKSDIIASYAFNVLMSKTPIPTYISHALNDFIGTFVSENDFTQTILPTVEKALLRSPELSLPVITEFFRAYDRRLDSDAFRRVVIQTINSAKSSNPSTRVNSVHLFSALLSPQKSGDLSSLAITELLTLPKTGKTAGPDHRVALYSMISYLTPSFAVSLSLIQAATPLLAKETHEAATAVLAAALPAHIIFLLKSETSIPTDTMNLISKEMGSTKPTIRKAFSTLAGDVLMEDEVDFGTGKALEFAKGLIPAWENALKTVSGNPLNSSGGPLDGYIAVAVLLGPLSRITQFTDIISRNAVLSSIVSSSTKPTFLLWDKVYQKLTDPVDESWFLRACDAALVYFQSEFGKNEMLRTQVGLALLHLSLEGSSPEIRRSVHRVIEKSTSNLPELTNRVLRDAMNTFLSRAIPAPKSGASEESTTRNQHLRFSTLLLSAVSFTEELNLEVREELVSELIILGHHPLICGNSRQTWIDLCQKARTDPRELTNTHLNRLLKLILAASAVDPKYRFPEASYSAISTLVFVSPEHVLPRIMEQLREDINPRVVNSLTEFDIGVWLTPEGATYVDVLASEKGQPQSANKGKDYEISKWEAEIRKSLASKKAAGAVTLTKQQQALVSAQLQEEAEVRQRVEGVREKLDRGLHIVRSLVTSGADEFRTQISSVASLLLEGALARGSILVGRAAFDTYLELAKCSSERLDTLRSWVGVATLRSLKVDAVPEALQAEPLNHLIIRLLYRLRTLSEQTPFDAATFSYAYPLLGQVLLQGGISVEDEEEALEQVSLALGIIKFHCGEFSSSAFPRVETIRNLLHIIRQQPKLSKDASTALVDLGEAIQANASQEELEALLRGTLMQEVYVRNSCLQCLQPFDLTDLDWSPELLIACHDEDEQNARLARHLWDDNGLDVPELYLDRLLIFLEHDNAYVRFSAAAAITEAVEHWPQTVSNTVNTLQDFYREKAKILAPEFDQYGMVIAQSLDRSDPWAARLATALAFELLSPSFTPSDVEPFFRFLIQDQALGDRTPDVRRGMLKAGTTIIDQHGAERLAALISLFENHLAQPSPATETDDHIKEAVIILFGRVARHLDPTDARIPTSVDRLVDALKTPSEQVQIAVSDCLSPLVRLMRPRLPHLVDGLMDDLMNAPKYAIRRGAAYGLAGVLKGTGIAGMKEFDIINRLRAGTEEKTRYEPRQGAMFAFETLSSTLGRIFEPYITYVLPILLSLFGDATLDVREATQDAARVIMGNMSGYGVKLILPSLLEGLDEKQWRSKKGSIELLGMMAYCSPRQLSVSLPIVIPRLTGVLTDSHAQVRTAANKSLKQFGEVISNPEIQSLVPVLLKALVDPTKTPIALSSLLKTSFMHYIDHSSLALVVPILERGLRERGADTKKKAAQIVGNLASLTDSKDFVPYLAELLPMVHVVLVDPVPEARATAAKALGTLVERLGEVHFPDLVPGLLRTLKTDTSGVDRQGAAQGLSEVLSGLGMERLEGLLPDIIANAQSPRPTVREGFMSLLVFLPSTFGTRFQPHLPKIISPILSGLADTEEYVREAAMRAGRMVVTNYSTKAIDLLLPELERGMFDSGWRIRQSSVTLVGELLFKVSGISGKTSDLEEEDVAAEATTADSSRRALLEVLGLERRNRILAALYLVRQDGVVGVRQTSIQIWKALVNNTPRTVREILPDLFNQVIFLISGDDFEQQETAARTTTELCRKFGEKILAEIMPIMKEKSTSLDARTREGVCLTLSEIMESTTESQQEDYADDIISMVRVSLVDDEANVRSAAAKAFDVLQEHLGAKAIDQTIPTLLEALRQPGKGSGTALEALREVMSVRASTVFPVLIPTLTAIPMTVFNARALSSLVSVAGTALSKRLSVILNALVKTFEDAEDAELRAALDEAIRSLFASINDAEGLNTLMMVLLGWGKHDSPKRRVSAYQFFAIFCEESELDSSLYRIDWIRQLISSFEDSQVAVHTAAWEAFDVFVKSIPKDELEPLVVPLRRSIESTGGIGQTVPGFSLPKGVSPTVPIIIAGLTTGSNEQREQAAYAIGDLVERTEESAIKPFVVPFTGPLIRVATQATTYPPAVKTAILSALTSMLERIPAFVKPFFPQLQRTFVKSASDPASVAVRNKAGQALGVLMKHQPRVDPVITELIAGVKSNDDAISSSLVNALASVVKSGSSNIGEKAREACVELVSDAFRDNHSEHYTQAIGPLVVSLSDHPDLLRPLVEAYLVAGTEQTMLSAHIILEVLTPEEDSDHGGQNLFQKLSLLRSVAQKVLDGVGNERPSIARPSREARDFLKQLDDDSLDGLF
ncbi:eIF-2-alpha kinase activator gcn1 [Hypsizygus marmoreus]|uniref:eIF-2-alpha kinase activator GCN1 n=1 Tax=Hypsizygus marmoreus TaxID=39966 RepID=A0A369JHH6_HYPMA|nr:eIF-2-alpha kinase activator gcn1 [Hypsizygus marmoreus]